jgi:MFS family permease
VLPAGLLGDRFGRKKVLLIALVLFGASSAFCSYATSAGELIVARAILGIGASAIFPLSLSVLPVLFAPEERQRAIAIMTSATFLSFPIGPLFGGWLLDNFWWGSVFLINVPVVVLAIIAVTFLLPESRSEHRQGVDYTGVIISSAGLAGLTYGFIKAGQDGWTNVAALTTIFAGAAVLAAFVGWERFVGRRAAERGPATGPSLPVRRPPQQPLVDLGLFRSAGFTWGTILITLVTFAMFGMLFAMPQYFQEVRGVNAFGSGLRLLPMIGGMMVGMISGTRLLTPRRGPAGQLSSPIASAKAGVAAGLAIMAAGLAAGAFTKAGSGTGFTAAWIVAAGLGLGLALPAAMNVALSALSAERSGSGSALITAMRQVGATIGVAILGTVLSTGYRGRVDVTDLPAATGNAVKSSVAVGVQVAHQLGSTALLDSVRSAFVHGMDIMLWTCGGIALTSALLALAFLPRRAASAPVTGAEAAPVGLPAGQLEAEQAELGL